MKLAVVLTCALALAGCNASGTSTQQVAAVAQPAANTVAKDRVQLLLTRLDTFLYAGVPVSVKLDGREIASLWKGATATAEASPGPHKLEVSCWSAPGTFAIDVDLPAGKAVAFTVSPRGEDFGVGVILGPLEAVRQSVVQNSGPFKIAQATSG